MWKVLCVALLANLFLVVENKGITPTTATTTEDDASDDCGCITDFDDCGIDETDCNSCTIEYDGENCLCNYDNGDDDPAEDECAETESPPNDCDCGTTSGDDSECLTDSTIDESTTDVTMTEIPINCTDALERTRKTLLNLSWTLAYTAAVEYPEKAFIGSILAVFLPRYQLLRYTTKDSFQYTDLTKALSIQAEEVCCITGKVNYDISKLSPNVFASGIAISVDSRFPLTNDFKKTMNDIGVAMNVNFSRPGSATEDINELQAKQTSDKIQETIPTSKLLPKITEMAITSAIYIMASGSFPLTQKPGVFNIAPFKSVKTTFVNGLIMCNYTESSNLKLLEFPLGDGLSAVFVLPPAYTQVKTLKSLSEDASIYEKLRSSMKPTLVDFTLPTTNITTFVNVFKYVKQGKIATSILDRNNASYNNAIVGNGTPILNAEFQNIDLVFSLSQVSSPSTAPKYSLFQARKTFSCDVPYLFIVFLDKLPILTSVVANVEPSSVNTMI